MDNRRNPIEFVPFINKAKQLLCNVNPRATRFETVFSEFATELFITLQPIQHEGIHWTIAGRIGYPIATLGKI